MKKSFFFFSILSISSQLCLAMARKNDLVNIYNIPNGAGETALFTAASKGELSVIEFLIEQGANPDIPDNQGRTPILIAKANGHDAVFNYLLSCKYGITQE